MKTIAIMNQKGGIGKTMTAASIAYLLGEEQGKKVLLVDADQQGNVSMLYVRIIGKTQKRRRILQDNRPDPDNTVSQY